MADLTPEQAIEKLKALPEDKQRQVLTALSPEQRKGILTKLQAPTAKTAPAPVPKSFYQRAKAGEPPPEPTGFKPYEEMGGLGRAVSSFESGFGIPQSVQKDPREALSGIGLAAMHPGLEYESLKEMWNSMTKAQQDLIDRSLSAKKAGNKADAFVLGLYGAIPFFGPAIVSALEQWKKGDKAGSIGSLTAIATQLYRPGEAKVATEPGIGEAGRMGEVAKPPKTERMRALAQGLTGAGPEATTEPLIEKHKAALRETEEATKAKTAEGFERGGLQRAAYDRKVAQQEAEYRQAVNEVTQFNAAQDQIKQRKQTLEKEVDTQSADLGKDIGALENAVYQEANKRFDAVRAKVGNAQAPSDALIGTVKDAEKNILQGIPENIKEFRSILGLEGATEEVTKLRNDIMKGQGMSGTYDQLSPEHKATVDDIVQRVGTSISPNEPLTWNKLQSLKSRLDQRLRSRGRINGDVKRALFSVRDGVVDEMGKMAVPAGAGPDWDAARDFYRQWREDFHEPTGPSGSGSPVAQALNAVDPANIRKPFVAKQSTLGNRGVDTLRKYTQFGGHQIADKAARVVANEGELSGLKPKTHKPLPGAPKTPPRPEPVKTKLPEEPPAPTAEDVKELKQRKLRETAVSWGKFHTYDLGILTGSALSPIFHGSWLPLIADPAFVGVRKSFGKILSKPAIRDWIARPLPEELGALDRLPEELKNDAREKLETFIRKNDVKRVAPAVKAFLTGAPISAAATKERRKPGEQIKDIQNIQKSYGSNPAIPMGPEP